MGARRKCRATAARRVLLPALCGLALSCTAPTRPVFTRIAADLAYLDYDFTKALKKALLMADWIGEVGTKDLESRYHVWAGAVRRIGEEYGWLVDAAAGVASASGWPNERGIRARSAREPPPFRSRP
jgi:replicative superfamily II helicase